MTTENANLFMVIFTALIAIGTVCMAIAAWKAYSSWKEQIQVNKSIETLDKFFESSQAFISECPSLDWFITIANIHMESHNHVTQDRYEQAQYFLSKDASSLANQMNAPLQTVRKHIEAIDYLAVKCQALNINNYQTIEQIRNNLVNIFIAYVNFHNIITIADTANYENDTVKKTIENSLLSINITTIHDGLDSNKKALIECYKAFFNDKLS